MSKMDWTVEEENILAMYYHPEKDLTIAEMTEVLPHPQLAADIRKLLEGIIEKVRSTDADTWQNLAVYGTFEQEGIEDAYEGE